MAKLQPFSLGLGATQKNLDVRKQKKSTNSSTGFDLVKHVGMGFRLTQSFSCNRAGISLKKFNFFIQKMQRKSNDSKMCSY